MALENQGGDAEGQIGALVERTGAFVAPNNECSVGGQGAGGEGLGEAYGYASSVSIRLMHVCLSGVLGEDIVGRSC